MTEKLYYDNQYIKEFTAEVINIIEKDSEFHIQLDKTAFFPGIDLLPCDIGSIEDSQISSVYEKNGIIYHVSNKKPVKIHRVKGKINWERRFDYMQQHLGQHILAAAFLELFSASIIKLSLGADICSLVLNKVLTYEQLEEAETLANKIIYGAVSVEAFTPSKAELKKLTIRKEGIAANNSLRIVRIEDTDCTYCCGLHPKSTIEVQLIRLSKTEKLKDGMKLEFKCGNRAVLDSLQVTNFSNKICKDLKCNEEEVLNRISSLTSELNTILAENKNLKSQIADYEVQGILNDCEKIGDIRIVKNIFINKDMKHITLLSTKLTSFNNVIVLHAIKADNMATLLFMCSKNLKALSMNDLLKDAISLIDGKGGGNAFSAQGGGKGVNNLESAVSYAFSKLKTLLR